MATCEQPARRASSDCDPADFTAASRSASVSIPKTYTQWYGSASLKGIETNAITHVTDDGMTLGERIREEREKRGLSQADLGRRVGISQVTVNKIETGKTVKSKWLPELMSVLSIPFTGSLPEAPVEGAVEDLALLRQTLPQDIPVKGVAVGGNDADFSFNGSVSDYVRRPPGLMKANGIYAVHVVSDSMSPRYSPGDLLFVSALRAPAIGDDVVVEMHSEEDGSPGKGFIKRLVKRSGSVVKLHQFNPDADIEIGADQIRSIHRVFTVNELFGV